MSNDYGHFGKGIEGYSHYVQSLEDKGKGGGGGGRGGGNEGCAAYIISFIAIVLFILIFGKR